MEEEGKVVISEKAVERSNEIKRSHRTLRQLPIYRDMSNLKYMIVEIYGRCPRNYLKYLDCVLGTVSEAKKCVGLAEASRDAAERASYLSTARVFIEDVIDDMTILKRIDVISGKYESRVKNQARSVVSQCVAWRDYESERGVHGLTEQ